MVKRKAVSGKDAVFSFLRLIRVSKIYCRFFCYVLLIKTLFVCDTHGRVCMKKPIKIRVDIYFFG